MAAAVNEGEVLDSWEDMDERQLERQTAEYLSSRSRAAAPTAVVLADDDPLDKARSMAQPGSMQQLKILKRPQAGAAAPGGGDAAAGNGDAKPRPMRTFQQRQRDYMAARLRILGEAGCPDDVAAAQTAPNVQARPDPTRLQQNNSNSRTGEKPAAAEAVVESPQLRLMNSLTAENGVSLLRAPRGPDSSRGFNLKR